MNVDYINKLFKTMKRKPSDIQGAGHIVIHMFSSEISFGQLNFTEKEFQTEKRRVCIGYINKLFDMLKQKSSDIQYAGRIETHMHLSGITFAELNFTEKELRAEARRAYIGYINKLFDMLKQKSSDIQYAEYIETHMRLSGITFAELNFTEKEFQAEKRRVCIGYINNLFNVLKRKSSDIQGAGHIETHMRLYGITFAELNFTKKEFNVVVKRINA